MSLLWALNFFSSLFADSHLIIHLTPMRYEWFFPENYVFHIPAPVHLLLLNPLNCLSLAHVPRPTLSCNTHFSLVHLFLHQQNGLIRLTNLQHILPFSYGAPPALCLLVKPMSGQGSLWPSHGNMDITRILLNQEYYFSVPLCAIESSYVFALYIGLYDTRRKWATKLMVETGGKSFRTRHIDEDMAS